MQTYRHITMPRMSQWLICFNAISDDTGMQANHQPGSQPRKNDGIEKGNPRSEVDHKKTPEKRG